MNRETLLKKFFRLQAHCYEILEDNYPSKMTARQVWGHLPLEYRRIFTPKSISNAMGALRKQSFVGYTSRYPRRYYARVPIEKEI